MKHMSDTKPNDIAADAAGEKLFEERLQEMLLSRRDLHDELKKGLKTFSSSLGSCSVRPGPKIRKSASTITASRAIPAAFRPLRSSGDRPVSWSGCLKSAGGTHWPRRGSTTRC